MDREPNTYRLGTRGSILARAQSEQIAGQLRQLRPDARIELHVIKTTGDRITDKQLHDIGGKGLFTKELELALLHGAIDFAVHSYKDVPVTMPLVDVSGLTIAAVPSREVANDVMIVATPVRSLADLPSGATVGTGSLRRQVQLLHHRPDLKIVPIRGNIDTRLRKQRGGELDAVVLAAAGLRRAGLFDAGRAIELAIEQFVPAAGQGALALQCRADDAETGQLLALLNDEQANLCTRLEREVIRQLNADCHSPIGVHARSVGEEIELLIANGSAGRVIYQRITGGLIDADHLIQSLIFQ